MFFKDYLISVADCLDAQLKGYKKQNHPGDTGELCEFFIKDFLSDSFSGLLRVFRGGKLIDSEGSQSEQIDIVLCTQNSLKIFSDKGLYPIETVYGVVNVKKELNHTNLFSDKKGDCGAIKNLISIPKQFKIHTGILDSGKVLENFKKRFPYKIIFAYEGQIQKNWEDELNNMVKNGVDVNILPDIIIVNKQGMITKSNDGEFTFTTGEKVQKYFHFLSLDTETSHHPFIDVLHELYKNASWQYMITPEYHQYFNKE